MQPYRFKFKGETFLHGTTRPYPLANRRLKREWNLTCQVYLPRRGTPHPCILCKDGEIFNPPMPRHCSTILLQKPKGTEDHGAVCPVSSVLLLAEIKKPISLGSSCRCHPACPAPERACHRTSSRRPGDRCHRSCRNRSLAHICRPTSGRFPRKPGCPQHSV